LNVSLLCDELNMGKTKLTAVMKEATGMSPGEYIEDVRLRHAAQMLESGNYTVTEVADKLGFSSASYFSVRFKEKFGVPPGRYPKRT
jgi:AraC-like DNA-binding protein